MTELLSIVAEAFKAVPRRYWPVLSIGIAGACLLWWRIEAVSTKLEEHRAEHIQQATDLKASMATFSSDLHAELAPLTAAVGDVARVGQLATDAKQQADRANARLDDSEKEEAYQPPQRLVQLLPRRAVDAATAAEVGSPP